MEEFMSVVLKKKIDILIILIIVIIIGMFCSRFLINNRYKSSTTLMLGRTSSLNNSEILSIEESSPLIKEELKIDSSLISTCNKIVNSDTLIKMIIDNLGLDISEKDLKKSIKLKKVFNTQIIEITATSTDSQTSSQIANIAAELLSNVLKKVYSLNEVYVIDSAVPNHMPYNKNILVTILPSIVLSLLVSLFYIFIYAKVDKKIKDEEDITEGADLKLLMSMPTRKKNKYKSQLEFLELNEGKNPSQEAFNHLRMNIQFNNINNKENKVLLFTSCFSAEGKSYIAANLAVNFAMFGKKVIIIDADMNRGKQAKIFNIPNNLGFSNYLSSLDKDGVEINERINKFINETGIRNLNVITSGSVPPNSAELLTSNKLPELIKELNIFYDLIIFDGAPVLPLPDSLILSRVSNSTILVSLRNKTIKDELIKAKKDIQNVGGNILGVVLNSSYIDHKEVKSSRKKREIKNETNNKKHINIRGSITRFREKFFQTIKKVKEKKHIRPRLLEKGKEEEIHEQITIEDLTQIIAPIISNEGKSTDDTVLFVDDLIKTVENQENKSEELKQEKSNVFDNSSEEDIQKLKEIENIEKEKRKLLKKERFDKIKKELKENLIHKTQKMQEFFKTRYNRYKQKSEERIKVKQKENFEKRKIAEEQNKIKKEERFKLARIREEEKIKSKEIKKIESAKKNHEKEEKKKRRDLKKQKEKEEARIKEELLDDNLYPKTKFNKSLQ